MSFKKIVPVRTAAKTSPAAAQPKPKPKARKKTARRRPIGG